MFFVGLEEFSYAWAALMLAMVIDDRLRPSRLTGGRELT